MTRTTADNAAIENPDSDAVEIAKSVIDVIVNITMQAIKQFPDLHADEHIT